MIDFGLLPPEINSGRMYAGPGSGSMLAAAAAWSGLAADMLAAAEGHRSVISELTGGPWLGPSSESLVAAVTPLIAWLDSGSVEAELTASQAYAAAAAYEAAFAATIPPPVIEANRALLAALVATNFLGQNTPAIMATEALYAEFWAQDAAAMYSYAGNAAAASEKLTELPQPAQVTTPSGLIDQAITSFQANAGALFQPLNQLGAEQSSPIGGLLNSLSGPINGNGAAIDAWIVANTPFDDLVPLQSKYVVPYISSFALVLQGTLDVGDNTAGWAKLGNLANTLFPAVQATQGAAQAAGQAAAGAATKVGSVSGLGGVGAGLGKAVPLGKLSVPASWTSSVPGATTPGVATLTNASSVSAAAPGAANGSAVAPPFGQYINGAGRGRKTPAYGFRLAFMTRPPAAG
jgi:PPE-repeat protein